jgi:hypothetical protein
VTHLVFITLYMFAVLGVFGMLRAVWIRAHDGVMSTKREIEADIEQDT